MLKRYRIIFYFALIVRGQSIFRIRCNVEYPKLYASDSDPQGKLFNCKFNILLD